MSQSQKILSHLKSGKSITQLDALNLYGCMRLASRIEELRDDHKIHTHMIASNGKRFAKYSLVA